MDGSPRRVPRVPAWHRSGTSAVRIRRLQRPPNPGTSPRDRAMPQMFDWIFFAIMLPFPAFLVWDWYQHR